MTAEFRRTNHEDGKSAKVGQVVFAILASLRFKVLAASSFPVPVGLSEKLLAGSSQNRESPHNAWPTRRCLNVPRAI